MPDALVHLDAGGVSVLIDVSRGLPSIVHWGTSLGDLDEAQVRALALAAIEPVVPNSIDEPIHVALLPESWTGWTGKPGIEGHRAGAAWAPRFLVESVELDGHPLADGFTQSEAGVLTVRAHDAQTQLALRLVIELTPSGIARTRATVRNDAEGTYDLTAIQFALPVPDRARELLDFAGRWGKERTPQRRDFMVGIHEREGRKGRTGADAATLLTAGVPGFDFASGEVWGVHVGFSGNHRHYAERLFSGKQVIGGGELLLPGEVRLGVGDEYESPWVYAAYGRGLDDQARRLHEYLRGRTNHPRTSRPVTLNVWEAVYFDHDQERLRALAELAADLGIERYVLDDGWFRGRRNDTVGLGDWYIDDEVWPEGLGALADYVRSLGMEFGLWFEPEMVNPDSDLARNHPEWILSVPGRSPVLSRNQLVLDLGDPGAYAYIRDRMVAVLESTPISYIKWDHNRDLVDAGSGSARTAGVHAQTLATYRLMDELKARFPGLEIESCSSGGARVDLGVLERTDRVWVSDCIDPLERQQMMRWTMQLLPPELLGSHIASGVSHSTGRSHTLAFRAASAFYGHLGVEWDLAAAREEEILQLRTWIEMHKHHRELLHTGTMIRVDTADPTLNLYGAVATDQTRALFVLASIGRSEVSPRGRFTLRGLDPHLSYRVRPVIPGGRPSGFIPAPWFGGSEGDAYEGIVLSGRALQEAGLHTPAMFPESAILLEVTVS